MPKLSVTSLHYMLLLDQIPSYFPISAIKGEIWVSEEEWNQRFGLL